MRSLLVLSLLAVVSCGPSEADLQAANARADDLAEETAALKKRLDEIENGAPRLLATARASSDVDAVGALQKLIGTHPDAPEVSEAKALLVAIEQRAAESKAKAAADALKAEKEQAAALTQATKRMKTKYDEIRDITWYRDRDSGLLGSFLQLYFGRQGKTMILPLRMKIQYQGDDWLFVQGIIIKADDKIFRLDEVEVERDNGSGSVWEWTDAAVDGYRADIVESILSAKNVTMRFQGRQYFSDKKISEAQRASMKAVVDAYRALGGIIPS